MNIRHPGFRPQKEEEKLRGARKNLGSHTLVWGAVGRQQAGGRARE